jgi:ubiquinone/menaquinone biosynthesis C-methylase UbiE
MGYQKKRVPVLPADEAYDKVAAEYDKDQAFYDEIDLKPFTQALPRELAGLKVLDAGGGTGRWAARLAKRDAKVTLADPAPAMVKLARKKDARIETVAAPVEALPFPDASFDIVLCAFVLGYVADLEAALAELTRVLAPGGLLLISQSPERKSPLHRVGNRNPFLIDVSYHRPEAFTAALERLRCPIEKLEQPESKKGTVLGTVIVARKHT